jgi:hypothetical protein
MIEEIHIELCTYCNGSLCPWSHIETSGIAAKYTNFQCIVLPLFVSPNKAIEHSVNTMTSSSTLPPGPMTPLGSSFVMAGSRSKYGFDE